jgi:ribosomal protein L19E
MGIFQEFFQYTVGSSTNNPTSVTQKPLPRQEIRRLVSRTKVQTLTNSEEAIVEKAIEAAKKGNGRISLKKIEETLRSLRLNQKISHHDYDSLMRVFEDYFQK